MAQKIVLTCDMAGDGTPAEETVKFGLDGREYEIDLSTRYHKELNDALRPFVEKARRLDGTRTRRRTPRATSASAATSTTPSPAPRAAAASPAPARRASSARKENVQSIREWARAHGMTVSDRGRISAEISEAYAAAHR